jgi:chorismate mutase
VRSIVILCLSFSLFGGRVAAQVAPVNENSAILADFSHRVAEYVKLRKQADAGMPVLKQTNSPHEIAERERLVAERIRDARGNAKQGDVFTPQIAGVFRHLMSSSFKSDEGKQIHQSLRHAEPVKDVSVRVNQAYPEAVPLQSMPPTLLQNLPELPKDLDYRIIDHDLILRDVQANLVIDIIPDAIPPSINANAHQ